MNTEERIIKNLRKNYENSIIILISHRLTNFSKINKIILLHDNKKVDYGTHIDLMERSKLYKSIYDLQGMGSGADEI